MLLSEFATIMKDVKALRKSKLELAVSKTKLAIELLSSGNAEDDMISSECKAGRDAAEEAFGVVGQCQHKLLATKVAIMCCVSDPKLSANPAACLHYVSHHLRKLYALPVAVACWSGTNGGFVGRLFGGAKKREAIVKGIDEVNNWVLTYFPAWGELKTGSSFKGAWVDDARCFRTDGDALVLCGARRLDIWVRFEDVSGDFCLPALRLSTFQPVVGLNSTKVVIKVNGKVYGTRALQVVVGKHCPVNSAWFGLGLVSLKAASKCSCVEIGIVNHSKWGRKTGISFEY
ncbi:unnamed protein product, partial [Ostreobium quekettii]